MKEELLDLLTTEITEESGFSPIYGVVVGFLTGFDEQGNPQVIFRQSRSNLPIPARTTVALEMQDAGREVTLMFEEGDPGRPLITGILQPAEPQLPDKKVDQPGLNDAVEVKVDNQRLILTAEQEVVLRCGKASITLTRAGKIILRGKYLLSRSSGVNRIKGGSVQIN